MTEEVLTINVPFVGYKTIPADQQQKHRIRTWEDKLKGESSLMMGARQPLTGDVRVAITACYLAERRTYDIDRIAKLILDGIKGIVIRDDSQVKKLEVEIRESCNEDRTIVEIAVIQK